LEAMLPRARGSDLELVLMAMARIGPAASRCVEAVRARTTGLDYDDRHLAQLATLAADAITR